MPQLRREGVDGALVIEGDGGKGWSLAPQAGLAFSLGHQDYNLDTLYANGALRQILRGDIDTRAGGVQLGLALLTPEWSGWRLGVTPSARLMAAKSKMTLKQDPYEVTGGMNTLTIVDSKTHLMANPALSLSAIGEFGRVRLSADVKGEYLSGSPYFDLTSSAGDKSRLGLSQSAYGLSGNLAVKLSF